MKTLLIGAASIALTTLLLLGLLLIKVDVTDVMYSMLAGGLIAIVWVFVAVCREDTARTPLLYLSTGIAGGAIGWFVGEGCTHLLTLQLYSITALAFDLLVGCIGSMTLCIWLHARPKSSDLSEAG